MFGMTVDCCEVAMRKTLQSNALAISMLLATILPCAARAASIKSSAVEIASPLTDDDGQPSGDISGVSCLQPQGAKRICLVIDDQGRLAQTATFEGSTLTGHA